MMHLIPVEAALLPLSSFAPCVHDIVLYLQSSSPSGLPFLEHQDISLSLSRFDYLKTMSTLNTSAAMYCWEIRIP